MPSTINSPPHQNTAEDNSHQHLENEDYADFDEDPFNYDKLPPRDKEVLEKEFSLNLSVHEIHDEKSYHTGGAKDNSTGSERVRCSLCGDSVKHKSSLKKHQDSKKCQNNRKSSATLPVTPVASQVCFIMP